MAERNVKIWFDAEGDYLEVIFDAAPGHFRPTGDDRVMEKVDVDGRVLGFSILNVTTLRRAPLELSL